MKRKPRNNRPIIKGTESAAIRGNVGKSTLANNKGDKSNPFSKTPPTFSNGSGAPKPKSTSLQSATKRKNKRPRKANVIPASHAPSGPSMTRVENQAKLTLTRTMGPQATSAQPIIFDLGNGAKSTVRMQAVSNSRFVLLDDEMKRDTMDEQRQEKEDFMQEEPDVVHETPQEHILLN